MFCPGVCLQVTASLNNGRKHTFNLVRVFFVSPSQEYEYGGFGGYFEHIDQPFAVKVRIPRARIGQGVESCSLTPKQRKRGCWNCWQRVSD